MKKTKRLLLVLPIIALLVAVLWAPATTSAAPKTRYEQLSATGLVLYIDEGNVKQLPNGRWLVKDRNVSGAFTGGAFAGLDFGLTYNGLIESAFTQVGVFQGEIAIDDRYEARVWGTTKAVLTPDWQYVLTYVPLGTVAYYAGDILTAKLIFIGLCSEDAELCGLPKIEFSGIWRLTSGTQGAGAFDGHFVFAPDFDAAGNPHVGAVIGESPYSQITMEGLWRQ